MTSITGAYVVVLTETRVGSRNARRLLDEAHHLNYYCRQPLGFVGGLPSFGTTSKWKCVVSLAMTGTCLVL